MLRNLLYAALGLLGLWAALYGTAELREREDAWRLAREAEQALSLPLARAPELSQLPAARALMLLEEALAKHDDPRSRALLAWAEALDLFQKSRFDRAQLAVAKAVRRLPKSADLHVLEAAIAMRLFQFQVAAKAIAKSLTIASTHSRARLLAADLAADQEQKERALSLLEGLIAEHPKVGPLYNRRGLLREAMADLPSAIADFETATLLDGSLPQPFINLGRMERERGNAKAAEAAFARALERDDDQSEAWLGRGLSRIAQGDLMGGALDVQRARDLAPAEPAPLVALGDIDVQQGRLDAALTRYQAALILAPNDAVAWLKLGNTWARKNAHPEARAAFQRALSLRPDMAAAHNGLGAVLLALGEFDNAEKAFAAAAELDSRDPNPLRNLALLRLRQGDLRAARGAYAEALARVEN